MSVSLHQRSLITCITTLSVWDELLLLNIKLVVLGSGWPLFGFSPLRICQVGGGGGIFWRYAGVGKECWKCAGTAAEVGSSCAGGHFGICCDWWYFFAHGQQSSFRWVWLEFQQQNEHKSKQWSECTFVFLEDALFLFFPPLFHFHLHPLDDASLYQRPRTSYERERSVAPGQMFWHRNQR